MKYEKTVTEPKTVVEKNETVENSGRRDFIKPGRGNSVALPADTGGDCRRQEFDAGIPPAH